MLAKHLLFAVFSVGICVSSNAQSAPDGRVPSDAAIRTIIAQRIEAKQGVGIVVGVVDEQGRRIIAYGSRAKGDPRPLTGDTIFEIGSVTKVFTSLLLSDMVVRGQVLLNDPASKYLPPSVRMPERGGRAITLEDLATHTSGLPRLPSNLKPADLNNPYSDYSLEQTL